MLMNFPSEVPFIETQRLFLRPICVSNAEAYFTLCSNKKVMNFYGVRSHTNLEETLGLINYLAEEFLQKRMIRWGIFEKKNPVHLIGDIGFWRFVSSRARAEIGTKLGVDYWKRGYASEAMKAVIDFGLTQMKLNSIEGNANPNNQSSCQMVENLGFIKEGYLKNHSYDAVKECFYDTVLYSLTSEGHYV